MVRRCVHAGSDADIAAQSEQAPDTAPPTCTDANNTADPTTPAPVGCVFAEILLRQPLFEGSSTTHQLQLIV